jgi:hypothetical protein
LLPPGDMAARNPLPIRASTKRPLLFSERPRLASRSKPVFLVRQYLADKSCAGAEGIGSDATGPFSASCHHAGRNRSPPGAVRRHCRRQSATRRRLARYITAAPRSGRAPRHSDNRSCAGSAPCCFLAAGLLPGMGPDAHRARQAADAARQRRGKAPFAVDDRRGAMFIGVSLRLWAESTCSTARGGFPQPVGPTTATNSASCTVRFICPTAV